MTLEQAAEVKPSHKRWLDEPLVVQRGQVSGLPAFWVPSDSELTAGLVFRSGVVDEPLQFSGINRIIEQLIMGDDTADDEVGDRDSWITGIGVQGTPESVVAEFARIGTVLARGLTGVDAARHLLVPAFATRPNGPIEELLRLRHGAQGLGNAAFDGYGLLRAGEQEIDAWRKRYFHAGGAAVWISGAFPDGLNIDVPAAKEVVTPTLMDPEVALPAVAIGAPNVVAISVLAGDSFAFGAASWLLCRRLKAFERATSLCHSLRIRTERCADGRIELLCSVVIDENKADEATRAILDVYEKLSSERPAEKELEDYRETVVARFFDPDGSADLAHLAATNHLLGTRDQSWDVVLQELQALDSGTVCTAFDRSLASAVLLLPRGVSAIERFTPLVAEPARIDGANFEAVAVRGQAKVRRALVASPLGITSTVANNTDTVLFGEVAMVARDDSGRRMLISNAGVKLIVDPAEWKRGDILIALIDKAVPMEKTVTRALFAASLTTEPSVASERLRWLRRPS